jgi:hypothetical protein
MTKLRREQAAFKDVVREDRSQLVDGNSRARADGRSASGRRCRAPGCACGHVSHQERSTALRGTGDWPGAETCASAGASTRPRIATSKQAREGGYSPSREGETRPRQWDVSSGDGSERSSQQTVGVRAPVPQGRPQLFGQPLGASRRSAQDCVGGMDRVPRSPQGSHTDASRGYGCKAQDRSARRGLCSPAWSTKIPHARG